MRWVLVVVGVDDGGWQGLHKLPVWVQYLEELMDLLKRPFLRCALRLGMASAWLVCSICP